MAVDDSEITTIDCQYGAPGHAAAFLIAGNGAAAFVDNNTSRAVPLLLDALERRGFRPEQVAYLIVTHVHLDHAGGTSALAARCPNAQVLCHPAAAPHLTNPARLVASVKQVYSAERFDALYGEVEALPAERVRAVAEGERIDVGRRALIMMHTPGHAKHHICIHDPASRGVFAGDMFGVMHASPLGRSAPCLMFSTAPTDFDPNLARDSIRRILTTGAERMYMTHFGVYEALGRGQAQLSDCLDEAEAIVNAAMAAGFEGEALGAYCEGCLRTAAAAHFSRWGESMTAADWKWIDEDIRLNAMGLVCTIARRRRGLRGTGQKE